MRIALFALAAAAALASASDAAAITRQQANAIAIRTLRPQAQPGRVVLFGLPRALAARRSVIAASPRRLGLPPRRTGLRPLGRKTWLFWLDLVHQAHFEHPSVLLLVDDRTGRVTRRQRLKYYPLVDGARPVFLRTRAAYNGARYRVFAGERSRRAIATVAPQTTLIPSNIPPNAFANDCVLMIGTWNDPMFERDFVDTERIMESLGARTFWVTSDDEPAERRPKGHGFVSSLAPNARHLAQEEDCKDIMILVSGHGTEAPGTTGVAVSEGAKLEPDHLTRVLRQNPNVTFKVKIMSCFSGRFREDRSFMERANLVLLETSSLATEYSYGALTLRDHEVPNPGRSEFVHSNLVGITKFVQSSAEIAQAQAAGGSLFARMLERAYTLGAASDAARRDGLTHPEPPHVNLAGALSLDVRVWWWHPPNSDFSFLCIAWSAEGAHDLRFSYFGGERGDSSEVTTQLAESPGRREGVVAMRIFAPGTYRVDVTAFTRDGRRLDRNVTVTVTSAQAGPSCGG